MRRILSLFLSVLFLTVSLPFGALADSDPEMPPAAEEHGAEEPAAPPSKPAAEPEAAPSPAQDQESDTLAEPETPAGQEKEEETPDAPVSPSEEPGAESDPDPADTPDTQENGPAAPEEAVPDPSEETDPHAETPEEEPSETEEPAEPETEEPEDEGPEEQDDELLALLPVELSHTGDGTVTASKATAVPGEAVTVFLTPDLGNILSALTLNGNDVTGLVVEGSFTFTMPAEGAVLAATFVPDPNLTAFGSCGKNAFFTLSNTGLLHITGTGAIYDYEPVSDDPGYGSTAPFSEYREIIVSVQIDPGITRIGNAAFRDLTALNSISLPDSLQAVGEGAFAFCSSLSSVEFPDKLKKIEAYAFASSALTAASLPAGLSCIGEQAFEDCRALTSVTLPVSGSYTRIEPFTFSGCTSLRQLNVPGNVLEIGQYAFCGCTALETVILPEYMEEIGSCAFKDCEALKSAAVPNGVRALGENAFENCAALEEVTFGPTLEEIRGNAFRCCTALSELYLPESIRLIGKDAFASSGITVLYFRGTAEKWDTVERPGFPDTIEVVCLGDTQIYEAAYTLSLNQQFPLKTDPEELVRALLWESESPEVCTLENGVITAKAPGVGYISGVGQFAGRQVSARIRIDVTEGENAGEEIISVSLPESSVTMELYKTNYARFTVLPNRGALRLGSDDDAPVGTGSVLTGARFTNETMNDLFMLRIVDDRTIEVIPTAYAIDNPGLIKSSYTSTFFVSLSDGRELAVLGKLTVKVKKTQPSIRMASVTLNSYYENASAVLAFTGGRVTAFEAPVLPDWLVLEGNTLRIGTGHRNCSGSVTLKFKCTVEGWCCPAEASLLVKASPVEPKIQFRTSTVSLNPGTLDRVTVAYTICAPQGAIDPSSVTLGSIVELGAGSVPLANGEPILAVLDTADGTLTLSAAAVNSSAHTYRVYLNIDDAQAGYITVKTVSSKSAAKLRLVQSGTVDTGIPQSTVTLTATPAYFHGRGLGENYSVRIYQSGSRTETVDVTDLFCIDAGTEAETGIFRIREQVMGSLLKKYTYTAEVSADLSGTGDKVVVASIKLNIRHTSPGRAKPSVTLKGSGYIDPLRSGTKISLTLKVKNCYTYTPSAEDLFFYSERGSNGSPLSDPPFLVSLQNGVFTVRQKPGTAVHASGSYYVQLNAKMDGKSVTSKRIRLSVKQGKVKLTSSRLNGTMLIADQYDTYLFHIGATDVSLNDISKVSMSSPLFTLTDLGNGDFCIGWKPSALTNRKLRPKVGSSKTVTLSVFFVGNATSKPNAKIKVKLKFATSFGVSDKIVEYAESYLGTPYKKYDCSMFAQKVYLHFDRHFARASYQQWRYVQSSSLWSYIPYHGGPIPVGAIIFFSAAGECDCGRPGDIHHVAISVGNGDMIDSTDKPGINCVNRRPYDSLLTHAGFPMHIAGYAMLNE